LSGLILFLRLLAAEGTGVITGGASGRPVFLAEMDQEIVHIFSSGLFRFKAYHIVLFPPSQFDKK